jgi:hypothetical protein
MTDDDAATGVAYETHDAPRLDRLADELRRATADDRDSDRSQRRRPLPRRFVRSTTVPVEPMS